MNCKIVSGCRKPYTLQHAPCVDKGNPLSPYDPDNTRVDLGALYFDQGSAGYDSLNTDISSFKIWPNPFSNILAITANIDRPTHINIDIYDLFGRHIVSLYDQDGECLRALSLHVEILDSCTARILGRNTCLNIFQYIRCGSHRKRIGII